MTDPMLPVSDTDLAGHQVDQAPAEEVIAPFNE